MRRWAAAVLVLLLLSTWAWGTDITERQAEELETDKLEEMTEGYLDQEFSEDIDLNAGLQELLERGQSALGGLLGSAVRSGGMLLILSLLCSLAQAMSEGLGGGTRMDLVSMAGALAIAAVSASDLTALMGLGRDTIQKLSDFSNLLMPTITAAAAASGSPTGAAARQLATLFFSNALITVIDRLLMPLVYAYVAASAAYAAVGNEGLKDIAGLLRWVVTTVLTGILLAFTGYLALSGAAAGHADALAVKTVKTAISGLVPVVGGILSDATETVLAGAGVLRGAIGIFGALGVLAFCLVPFLNLGVHYLTYKAAAVLASTLARGRIAGLIGSLGGAFGLVLGMAGSCGLLMLISLITAVGVVTP